MQNVKYCLSRTTYNLVSTEEIRLNVQRQNDNIHRRYGIPILDQFYLMKVEMEVEMEVENERLKNLTVFLSKMIEFEDIGTCPYRGGG